jgi:hypothetical protein
MQAIEHFVNELHPYSDGKSAERILDAIDAFIAAGAKNPRKKPLNLWRKFKLYKSLNHWEI